VDKLRVFVERAGYEPGNLCVLVPRNLEIAPMLERLAAAGYPGVDITEDPFSFHDDERVRVSTLHSSKGLDFPVVLLYLPYLPRREHLDDTQGDRLVRNLLYVGITRAMDNLNVFAVEAVARSDAVVAGLLASFAAGPA
jgi:superfamily I DNA/RNA helicase